MMKTFCGNSLVLIVRIRSISTARGPSSQNRLNQNSFKKVYLLCHLNGNKLCISAEMIQNCRSSSITLQFTGDQIVTFKRAFVRAERKTSFARINRPTASEPENGGIDGRRRLPRYLPEEGARIQNQAQALVELRTFVRQ